jgi:hypothetical protein
VTLDDAVAWCVEHDAEVLFLHEDAQPVVAVYRHDTLADRDVVVKARTLQDAVARWIERGAGP